MPGTGRRYRGQILRAMTRARTDSSCPSRRSFVRGEGSLSDARELANEAVRLADDTDALNVIASTRLALAVSSVWPVSTARQRQRFARRSHCSSCKGNVLARRTRASLLRHQQARCMRRARRCGPLVRSVDSSLSDQRASPSAYATSGAASASRPTASTTSVRCSEVTWRMIPSSRDSCVRRSRSIRPLTARPRATNEPLIAEQFRRSISMRRMLEICASRDLGRAPIFHRRNHDL